MRSRRPTRSGRSARRSTPPTGSCATSRRPGCWSRRWRSGGVRLKASYWLPSRGIDGEKVQSDLRLRIKVGLQKAGSDPPSHHGRPWRPRATADPAGPATNGTPAAGTNGVRRRIRPTRPRPTSTRTPRPPTPPAGRLPRHPLADRRRDPSGQGRGRRRGGEHARRREGLKQGSSVGVGREDARSRIHQMANM